MRLARSYGAGGQRYRPEGGEMITTPPSSMAASWRRNRAVCGPAFQAWGIRWLAAR